MKTPIETLFDATASSPLELAMLKSGSVGFIVPEYQRPYDWEEDDIKRLYCDILNGFKRRWTSSEKAHTYTFLGSIILVKEKQKKFSGESISIVDGQQRLTTLVLLACALCSALRYEFDRVDGDAIDKNIYRWLKSEVEKQELDLYACALGSLRITPTEYFPFAKIIRHGDTRGNNKADSEYRSPIGKFLEGFAEYFTTNDIEYVPPALGKYALSERLSNNFEIIKEKLVRNINNSDWYDETECELIDVRNLPRGQNRELLGRLPDNNADRVVNYICKNPKIHGLIRTLMFSYYFCNYIVLTRVITEDESIAFDIFDALNTTGQPLTALETLKPRVIKFEKDDRGRYPGSESEMAFHTIEEYIDKRFPKTSDKQSETKDLIITFALYSEGKQLSKDLADQRMFLRTGYEKAVHAGENAARKYVDALARIAKLRRFYWDKEGIKDLNRFHNKEVIVDDVKLFISFIYEMKTSLILPVLSRYWNPDDKNFNDNDFFHVLRALVSFLVLRRAATGGTDGIDGDFRKIMAPKVNNISMNTFGLCAGANHQNIILGVDDLKAILRNLLIKKFKTKTIDKEAWVERVIAQPLYKKSRVLSRFMIFSAAHHSLVSDKPDGAGIWQRCGVRKSEDNRNFLNYTTWCSDRYSTVEHIAPETLGSGWDSELYENDNLRHSLGNLILLPSNENSSINNSSWDKKQRFYTAVTETTKEGLDQQIQKAKSAGNSFSKNMIELLNGGSYLSLLTPLRDVQTWNKKIVQRRSRNIAELCWDIVWPWLE